LLPVDFAIPRFLDVFASHVIERRNLPDALPGVCADHLDPYPDRF
jgi:hypothetical protein